MPQPFFSVLIPSYNRPEFLKACVDSILQSDFTDFEIIISDDKSPKADEIELVLAPVLCRANVKFIKQPVNLGWSDNRNCLVANASGKYSILLGDDDKLFPYSLSRLHENIKNNPGYELYSIGFTVIDEDDEVYYSCTSPKQIEISNMYPKLVNLLLNSDIIPFWIFHPFTMCFKTSIRDRVNYVKDAFIGDDLLFMYDCMNVGYKMLVIPESLFMWRKAQKIDKTKYQNLSTSSLNSIKARANILSYMRKNIERYPVLFQYVMSKQYSRKFLFDIITFDKSITVEKLDGLKQADLNVDEMLREYRIDRTYMTQVCIRTYHLRSYLSIYGLSGVLNVAGCALQKLTYRIKKQGRWALC